MTLQIPGREDLCERIFGDGLRRLSMVREEYQTLDRDSLSGLLELFEAWRDYPEYMVVRGIHRETGERRWCAVKSSKRGNDVFARRLDDRLGFLDGDGVFFNPWVENQKDVKTRLLWVTLTYDPSWCSMDEAWRTIGEKFNLWITTMRYRYGEIAYVSFPQAFPDQEGRAYGYPHFHVILLFKDHEFNVFGHMETIDRGENKGQKELVWRIQERDELEFQGHWNAFIDVKALGSMRAVWNYAKKHCYNAGYGSSDEAIVNNAIMWFYSKKSFNMSGDFRDHYIESIVRAMHSSKIQETFDVDERGQKVVLADWTWEFVGLFTVHEMKNIVGERMEGDPPWTVRLSDGEGKAFKKIVDDQGGHHSGRIRIQGHGITYGSGRRFAMMAVEGDRWVVDPRYGAS